MRYGIIENKNIIVILVAIIIVLAVIAGAMFLQSANAKEPTKIRITSDKSQYEGGNVEIQLTDLNKTAISKENVNLTITNSKGKVVVDEAVKTNSNGKAKIDLDLKKGKYTVNVTYSGNDNYTGNKTTQKLTIKEVSTSEENSVDMSLYPGYSPEIGYYRTIETQQELAVLETPGGNYYVMSGDGIRQYEGHDSQGYIRLGTPID